MFVSPKKGASKKPFQKPNILRRKSKVRLNASQGNEAAEKLDPSSSNDITVAMSSDIEQGEEIYGQTFQLIQAPKFDFVHIREMSENASQRLEISGDNITIYVPPELTEPTNSTLIDVEAFLNDGVKQNDFVLLDGTLSSNKIKNKDLQKWSSNLFNENSKEDTNNYDGSQPSSISSDKLSSNIKMKTAKFFNVVPPINIKPYTIQIEASQTNAVDEIVPSGATKFSCDVPNCEKTFWTELRLQDHKNNHKKLNSTPKIVECPVKKTGADGALIFCGRTFSNRNQVVKHLKKDHTPDEALYSCPKCGRHFFYGVGARSHALTNCTRVYECTWAGCGRVFRQQCRLREHARAHTGDRPYACTYPECNWAFRSASKLMRHMRGHTGERRHECTACGRAYPRKEHLRDHITRHHTQSSCDVAATPDGGATPESATQPNISATQPDLSATQIDCVAPESKIIATIEECTDEEVIAIDPEEMYSKPIKHFGTHHMFQNELKNKNVNKKQSTKRALKSDKLKNTSVVNSTDQAHKILSNENVNINQENIKNNIKESLNGVRILEDSVHSAVLQDSVHSVVIPDDSMVIEDHSVVIQDDSVVIQDDSVVIHDDGVVIHDDSVVMENVSEERCARTHCTWPLQRTQYSIEDDTQVEQSESSESNIYTVRSDLFLHGNQLINEDSEFIINRTEPSESGDTEEVAARVSRGGEESLDELPLIDSHPTIDLMQEELMYADAVDETSFRVLLLNGEELT